MLAVRNSNGQMVNLFLTILQKGTNGYNYHLRITRFDNAMAVQIGGSQARGYSSGDAINALKRGRR